ncbi:DUF4333 domain-containing protein [Blastococcus sp. VKM Ac-2987]|uniref:DUF4333 domain-containing protein n=1 Tax=Blastococcus sp. VKM Ac-2987 TaxID=3004141 RepID=UPI0022AB9621|nr:DUF4333 domain-containing protein [Blastococcus sp. VKM Ac-2987]MCZ2860706.1 DUF4333 domain-containing protein [Blastococcus sp. VKM Ac-2987]
MAPETSSYPSTAQAPGYVAPGRPAGYHPLPPVPPVPPPGFGPSPLPPSPPRRSTGRIAAAVGGVVFAVAGLAGGALLLLGDPTLDTAGVADRIAAETAQQAGVAATDVDCPTDVTAEAGGTFTCSAQLDGQPVTFTVRQEDGDGNVRFDLDDEIVMLDLVEQILAEQVGADYGVPVTASCDAGGRRVLVDGSQTPLPCTVTNVDDVSDSLAVTATVLSDGSVDYVEA